RRIERSSKLRVANAAEVVFKVALALEHVAQIICAGKAEIAIHLGRHAVVVDFLAQHLREGSSHLGARKILAGDRDGLPDEFTPCLENSVGTSANILGSDPGKRFVIHRKRDREFAVGTGGGSHPEM